MKLIQRFRSRAPDATGFTLIELIIVIAIIGILVIVALPVYGTMQGNARKATVSNMAARGYESSMAAFYDDSSLTTPATSVLELSNDDVDITVAAGRLYPASDFCILATWTGSGQSVADSRGDC